MLDSSSAFPAASERALACALNCFIGVLLDSIDELVRCDPLGKRVHVAVSIARVDVAVITPASTATKHFKEHAAAGVRWDWRECNVKHNRSRSRTVTDGGVEREDETVPLDGHTVEGPLNVRASALEIPCRFVKGGNVEPTNGETDLTFVLG